MTFQKRTSMDLCPSRWKTYGTPVLGIVRPTDVHIWSILTQTFRTHLMWAATTYESSAAIRQLQLNEINEASPDNEDDEAFKDDVLELADSRKNSADGGDSRNVFVHTETENTERSRWMDRLPAHLKEIPLHHLFIPGNSYLLERVQV